MLVCQGRRFLGTLGTRAAFPRRQGDKGGKPRSVGAQKAARDGERRSRAAAIRIFAPLAVDGLVVRLPSKYEAEHREHGEKDLDPADLSGAHTKTDLDE